MSFTDSPDYQETAVTVSATGDTPDAPDYQRVVVGPGAVPIGGGYKSLTGDGETTTPGDLTQAGGLTVDVSSDMGVAVTNSGAGAITLDNKGVGPIKLVNTAGGGIVLDDEGEGLTLNAAANASLTAGGALTITGGGGSVWTTTGSLTIGDTNLQDLDLVAEASSSVMHMRADDIYIGTQYDFKVAGTIEIGDTSGGTETTINFPMGFGTSASRQTVTGSKGGNAALASLLTALQTYGLIVDSTT